MTWEKGRDSIEDLLHGGHLERVPANTAEAEHLSAKASSHLMTAATVASIDAVSVCAAMDDYYEVSLVIRAHLAFPHLVREYAKALQHTPRRLAGFPKPGPGRRLPLAAAHTIADKICVDTGVWLDADVGMRRARILREAHQTLRSRR